MAREQELKLTITESSAAMIHDWLAENGAEPMPIQNLRNTYFDTADAQLNRQRAALRIRQSDGGIVQTLKTKGTATRGLHDRQEWDWPLANPELDLGALADSAMGDLAGREELGPIFTTDFERSAWLWRNQSGMIEFALDRGNVVCDNRAVPISEVELELKEGEPSILIAQAKCLSQICSVFLNPVSKAEQGYFLAGLYHPTVSEIPRHASFPELLDAWFQALGLYALTGQRVFLEHARAAMKGLSEAQPQSGVGSGTDRLTSEQWAQLVQLHAGLGPAEPRQVRKQLLKDPLLGQCQLRLIEG